MAEPAKKKSRPAPVETMWARVAPGQWRRVRHPLSATLPGRAVFEVAAHETSVAGVRRPTCPLRSMAFHSVMCAMNEPIYYDVRYGYDYDCWDRGSLLECDAAYHADLAYDFPVLDVVARNYSQITGHGARADGCWRAHLNPRGRGGFGGRPWIDRDHTWIDRDDTWIHLRG